jgi:hypothetical protein
MFDRVAPPTTGPTPCSRSGGTGPGGGTPAAAGLGDVCLDRAAGTVCATCSPEELATSGAYVKLDRASPSACSQRRPPERAQTMPVARRHSLALPFSGRDVRRGHHLVRAAQHRGHRRRPAKSWRGRRSPRPGGRLVVLRFSAVYAVRRESAKTRCAHYQRAARRGPLNPDTAVRQNRPESIRARPDQAGSAMMARPAGPRSPGATSPAVWSALRVPDLGRPAA